jgi:flagellar biogenesis protein FliO
MYLNILQTPYGQLGLVLLFIITLVVLVKWFDKRTRKKQRKVKNKV